MTGTLIQDPPSLTPTALFHHANILSLITAPPLEDEDTPRLKRYELIEFLDYLAESFVNDQPYIPPNKKWAMEIVKEAQKALRLIDIETKEEGKFLEPEMVKKILFGLTRLFEPYDLFGLIVGTFIERATLDSILRVAVNRFNNVALILDSHYEENDPRFGVLDPLPPVAALAEHPECWPGVVLWSKTGATAFLPESNLNGNGAIPFCDFFENIHDPMKMDEMLAQYKSTQPRGKLILHLSDLHCGSDEALKNLPLLMAHIRKKLDLVDRVIITGDLMQTPSDKNANLYLIFHTHLQGICPKDPILVPGNHDERWEGLLVENLDPMLRLFGKFPRVEIDDDLGTVFFCFDSSKHSPSSWGKIHFTQLRDIEREFTTGYNRNTSLADYLFMGLLHHHPFSFREEGGHPIQRAYNYLEEDYLKLEDAEEFHIWCAKKSVPILLHGHKHVPRHIQKEITHADINLGKEENFIIDAIGCGTSLGAGGHLMSYNVLIWDSVSQRWAITFWQDSGQGVFKRRYVEVERK